MKGKMFLGKKKFFIGGIAGALALLIIALIVINVNMQEPMYFRGENARAMTYDQFIDGDEAINGIDNVTFSAFFLRDLDGDGYAEKIKGTCKEIGTEDTMYMELKVQTAGYLKNGKIEIQAKNFYLQTALPEDEELKQSYIGNNIKEIEFNDIKNGTQKLLSGIVRSGDYNYSYSKASAIGSNINNYSVDDNKVILTGIYVAEDGTEKEIRKEINLETDWYGTGAASIYGSGNYYRDLDSRINNETNRLSLSFSFTVNEYQKDLLLKNNYIEGTIPDLEGFAPVEVRSTAKGFTYDAATKKFRISKDAVVNEEGNITSSISDTSSYSVTVEYPIEAYQAIGTDYVVIKIPVSTYYQCYNNPNTEFDNPYITNTASATITATYTNEVITHISSYDIDVGRRLYSPNQRWMISKEKPLRIYNGLSSVEKNDIYTVKWYVYTGTNDVVDSLVIKETPYDESQKVDTFIKNDSTEVFMENVVSNVGIYFSGVDKFLGDDGYIHVYNDVTGELVKTFTKDDWNKYNSSSYYKFQVPVKHIRIETSKSTQDSGFYVYSIKELDDEYITENYTIDEFNNLSYIKSNMVVYVNGELKANYAKRAVYEAPFAMSKISLSNDVITTQKTEKNEIIKIETVVDSSNNQVGWINGSFIVKFPQEILTVDLNNININNGTVKIASYEIIEIDGCKAIKINTNNTSSTSYIISLDVDITPDPRIETTYKSVTLYASNENANRYYSSTADIYDVNDNLNLEESVNTASDSINLVAPNTLLTTQIVTNYNVEGDTVVSPQIADIRPIYANVDNEENRATVGVQIKNNYSSTIEDIVILGKIPFVNNTYVLSGDELNSDFSGRMDKTGIIPPENLGKNTIIYYSEQDDPTKEIQDITNGWTLAENVSNWDNIKSFLIMIQDYALASGEEAIFNYTVILPNGIDFNKVTYSHHGVYFSLNTPEGKYRTQVEPNKVGYRVAEKYNLELTKYQYGKDKKIAGATYSVTELNDDGSYAGTKTAVTNENGTLVIQNLYAEKIYEITEIKTPIEYELNEDKVRIIGHVDSDGVLTVEKVQGNIKDEITVKKVEGEYDRVVVNVEDEVKAKIKITKYEKDTTNVISKVRYKLTGAGLPEKGRTIITGINGEISLSGLLIGEEYLLEEVKAEGYYLHEIIKFKIVNTDGVYSVEILEGTPKQSEIVEDNFIPTLNLVLEDEKIPTYNLELTKIKKITEVETIEENQNQEIIYLPGAKFELYKDNKKQGEYITNEEGKLLINNLYAYEENKNFDATYVLKEVIAPEGYSKVKDITFKVSLKDGVYTFEEQLADGQKQKVSSSEGNNVKITVEDNPSFKLIKKDAETGALLPNVKFVFYSVDDGQVEAKNSKGEIIGNKEIIDGVEYYVVSTDENGEITLDLPEGFYKAVEVNAPEQYDIENNVYYFGIGVSSEANEHYYPIWVNPIYGLYNYTGDGYEVTPTGGDVEISVGDMSDVEIVEDGVVSVGNIYSYGNYTGVMVKDNEIIPCESGEYGIVIKYNNNGDYDWIKTYKSTSINLEFIENTVDEGFIVGGMYNGSLALDENISMSSYKTNGVILKLDSIGNTEWTRQFISDSYSYIDDIETMNDGSVLVTLYANAGTLTLDETTTISVAENNESYLIKYDFDGNLEWYQKIVDTGKISSTQIECLNDGRLIVSGNIEDTVKIGENEIIPDGTNAIIIVYNIDRTIAKIKLFNNTNSNYIYDLQATLDNGFIVGGKYYTEIDLDENIKLTNKGKSDQLLIKYNSNCDIEWYKDDGSTQDEQVTNIDVNNEGNILVSGYVYDSSISTTRQDYILYDKNGNVIFAEYNDGYVEGGKLTEDNDIVVVETTWGDEIDFGYGKKITYQDHNGVTFLESSAIAYYDHIEEKVVNTIEERTINGSHNDYMIDICETSDGGSVTVGYFYSPELKLDDNHILYNTNTSSNDGVIVKYDVSGKVEWVKHWKGTNGNNINNVDVADNGDIIVSATYTGNMISEGEFETEGASNVDTLIARYTNLGELLWYKKIGKSSTTEYVREIASTEDNGIVIVGYFDGSIDLGNGYVIETIESKRNSGMIVKLNEYGETEWAKTIVGDKDLKLSKVKQSTDGGYAIVGITNSKYFDIGNDITLANKTTTDNAFVDFVIKINNVGKTEWGNVFSVNNYSRRAALETTKDGGIIVADNSGYTYTLDDGTKLGKDYIIKYSNKGNIEWIENNSLADSRIYTIKETKDGGYIIGGYLYSMELANGIKVNSGAGIIKLDKNRNVEWSYNIKNASGVQEVVETRMGTYLLISHINGWNSGDEDSSVSLLGGISLLGGEPSEGWEDDSSIIYNVYVSQGAQEVQELIVENTRKLFNITTEIEEIDGIKGGTISGEDKSSYEAIKFGESSVNEIKIIPDTNYEIIGITVNGKEHQFEEAEDGSYIMPAFTDVREDKHIVAKFSLKDNKIIINKIDSETKEKLTGATFKLDQIEEREEPTNVIGDIVDNGSIYYENNELYNERLGVMTANGAKYGITVPLNEVTDFAFEMVNNGTYYFEMQNDGTYAPTNSKLWQVANVEGATTGVANSTANSYIEIDLTDKTGTYVAIVNASISSESGYDFGCATIGTDTTAPTYSTSTNRFMYISGNVDAADYTSMVLEGGSKYYLHLGYKKDNSGDKNNDQVIINSIKLYTAEGTFTSYNFIENESGGFESNNQGIASTVANSYMTVDLQDVEGYYNLVVNANVSSQSGGDYGYATVTETVDAPAYNASTGRFIYISGTSSAVITAKDYTTRLEGGKVYYLHFGYYKNSTTDTGNDKFTINSINLYNAVPTTYEFVEVDGKYESNNTGLDNRTANSYIPINLTNYKGKYNLVVNANVSSAIGDYGYATVLKTTTAPSYSNSVGRFIYLTGTTNSVITPTDYIFVLDGGYTYYLHFGYYKNSTTSSGDDKFTINSVNITLNDSELYHTTVETNENGQAITQLPFGKYAITETVAPEGYELNSNSILVEFRADQNHEFEIENSKKARVIVNHKKAILNDDGTITYTDEVLAEQDIIEGIIGQEYIASPNLDIPKYDLLKDSAGNYIIPENASGTYAPGDIIVTYYYDAAEIPLIVNHYVFGTQENVELNDDTTAAPIMMMGKEGESYTTESLTPDVLHEKYELVETPDNATGTYEYSDVTVDYYYKVKTFDVTTETLNEGGTISGETDTVYENIQYGESSQKEIVIEPEENYYVDALTVNVAPVAFTALDDDIVTLDQFINVKEDKNVAVTFAIKQGNVIVHHYKAIENDDGSYTYTTEKIVDDELKTGNVGDMFATQISSLIPVYYEYIDATGNTSGTYTEDDQEVNYYYAYKDYKYTVKYFYDGVIDETKTDILEATYGDSIEYYEDKNIDGYKKSIVSSLPIVIDYVEENNVIEVYYEKDDFDYRIEYYYDGVIDNSKTIINKKQFKDIIDTYEDKNIDGYKLDTVDGLPLEITSNPDNNIIKVYYIKDNFEYRVEYYYDNVIDENKTIVDIKQFKDIVDIYEDKIIDGYKLDTVDGLPLEITSNPDNNVIKVYYDKRTDLSYTVNYLEKDTNEVLAETKVVNNQTYKSTVTETAIEIDGYNKVEETKSIVIEVEGNVINFYYTKRTDLSYTVNYLEKDTNEILAEAKVVNGQTYKDTVTETAIEINGYDKVDPTEQSILIEVEGNVINFYYTKRTDLSYTVNYLEEGSNEILAEAKVVNNQTYKDTVTETAIEIVGYDKVEPTEQSIVIEVEENVINFYYTKRTDLSYTVNYLEKDTNEILAEAKVVNNQTYKSTVTETAIEIDGYDKVEETKSIVIEIEGNVINFYYTKRSDLSYKVEYYFNNVKDESLTYVVDNQVFDTEITTYEDKIKPGYKFEKDTIPMVVTTGENIISVYYVTDESKTKELSYTVEYYKDGILDITDKETKVVQLLEQDVLEVSKEKINIIDKYEGYAVDSTDPSIIPDVVNNGTVIKIYYVRNIFNYTVEYYFEGVKDEALTETKSALYGDEINTYTDNVKVGYRLDKVDTLPLVISKDESANIIKVYYVIDETQTKELSYTVEYYKDDVLVDTDTQTKTQTVQVLEPDILTVDKTDINVTDKYYGYKLDAKTIIPDTVNNGEVIKVYYVIDPSNTKVIEYITEIYKEDTERPEIIEGHKTVQVLEPDEVVYDKAAILIDNRYTGFSLETTEADLPNTVKNGDVVKVYYKKNIYNYTVNYYYDGILDDSKTDILTAKFDTRIETVKDKVIEGYKFQTTGPVPLIIGDVEATNIFEMFYVKDSFEYTVEYYYNGIKDDNATVTSTALYQSEITTYEDKVRQGYKLERTENNPLTITADSVNNVMKVYYIIDDSQTKELSYTVEYYKDGVKVDADTQVETQTVQILAPDVVTVDKAKINLSDKYLGYKTENVVIPDTVNSGDVIRVDYVLDDSQTKELSYTVEYYKDGVKVESDTQVETQTVQILAPNTVTVDKTKINLADKYLGYKTENVVIPDTVNSGDVIRVDYVLDNSQTKELSYTVEYYKDGVKVDADTQVETVTVQVLQPDTMIVNKDKINLADKYLGYKTENVVIPDTVNSGDVIRVDYVLDDSQTKELSYTVEYYKDGVKVDADTQVETVTVQILAPNTVTVDKTKINLADKYLGYKTENVVIPDTVNSGDVIRVDYVLDNAQTKELSYTVEYYKDGVKVDADTQVETVTVQILAPDVITVDKTKINLTNKYPGYKTENVIIPDTVNSGDVIRVDYVLDDSQTKELSYTVEYYKDGVKVDADTQVETVTVQILAPNTVTVDKTKINLADKYLGYKTENVVIPDTVNSGDVIRVDYVLDNAQTKELSYTVEYYKDGVKVESDTQVETVTVQILAPNTVTVDKTKINLAYKYLGYKTENIVIPDTVENGAVIRVDYVVDETQTKELFYTVEYYKDGVLADTEVERITAQLLAPNTVTVDKTKINLADKYLGYKTENVVIPDTVNSGDVIRVDYVIDDSQTKELSYTVEYYKDGVLTDTQVETVTVQILAPDVITVDKTKINLTNKYPGYKTENVIIPDTVENGAVIRVDYVEDNAQTKELSYTVEYYKEGVLTDTEVERVTVQILDPDIITVDKTKINLINKYYGYKTENVVIPDTVENGAVIRVDYVIDETQTKELFYTVEYYKDDVLVTTDTETETVTVQVLESEVITVNKDKINITDKYAGYALDTEKTNIPDTVNSGESIKVYYKTNVFEYRVEYYFGNNIDDTLTVRNTANYGETITTYEDKVTAGYKLATVENLPLVVTENEETNVIKVYYVIDDGQTKELSYTVEYYKDDVLVDTETEIASVQVLDSDAITVNKDKINLTDKYEGYLFDRTEPEVIPDSVRTGTVIKVYYRVIPKVIVKYVDIITGEEVSEEIIIEGEYDESYDITEHLKEREGYTLLISPSLTGEFTNAVEEKVFSYAKNTEVIVKYLEKDTDVELLPEERIAGYEGKDYVSESKDVENYTYVESINAEGKMTVDPVTVVTHYYLQNSKVTVNYIDKNTEEVLDTVVFEGKVGDEFTAINKEFDNYVLVEAPENATVTLTKEEIVLNYYYLYVSEGLVEKHIDIVTGESLETISHEGKEGDEYFIDSKEFEGYDLVTNDRYFEKFIEDMFTDEEVEKLLKEYKVQTEEELFEQYRSELVLKVLTDKKLASNDTYIPENREGVLTKELIEVKYYYVRKSNVKVEYIDKTTGNSMTEVVEVDTDGDGINDSEEIRDVVVMISGHEEDKYETTAKEFEGYVLAKDKSGKDILPENAKGNMTKEDIIVRYYYVKVTKVTERHIDSVTNEYLEPEKVHDGYVGKEYDIKAKEFDGFVLMENKLPTNAKGEMTETEIIVEYYYIHKAKVTVEYIDKNTGEKILEVINVDIDGDGFADMPEEKDSTVVFEGYEGNPYKAVQKEFVDYVIVADKLPNNAEGTMTKEDIVVRYYYVHESKGVREEHIDIRTNKYLEDVKHHSGNEGDAYNIPSKQFNNYDVVTDRLPNNSKGKMTKDEIVVKYYYIKKAEVIVKYVDKESNAPVSTEDKLSGHDGDLYKTVPKDVPGYTVSVIPANAEGAMDGNNIIIVTFYYDKVKTPAPNNTNNNNNNNNNNNAQHVIISNTVTNNKPSNVVVNKDYGKDYSVVTPGTGDNTPIIIITILGITVVANIIYFINRKKKSKKDSNEEVKKDTK